MKNAQVVSQPIQAIANYLRHFIDHGDAILSQYLFFVNVVRCVLNESYSCIIIALE